MTIATKRAESLSYANRIRTARAAVKRGVAEGRYNPLEILQEPTELIEGMKVRELLLAIQRLGPAKIDPCMDRARISRTELIGNVPSHRIWALDECLTEYKAWRDAIRPRQDNRRTAFLSEPT